MIRDEATGAEPTQYTLPNGLVVDSPAEDDVEGLWRELSAGAYDGALDLRPGDTVIDVGAHIGLASLYLAHKIKNLRIIACEPAPRLFRCLRANAERHLPGSTALATAIGATAGTAELTYYPEHPTMTTLRVDEADDQRNFGAVMANVGVHDEAAWRPAWEQAREKSERVDVPVRTLADVFAEQDVRNVGLLKVDVERSELDVLGGLDEANWPAIRTIAVEVHDVDGALDRARTLLETRGYEVDVTQHPIFTGSSVHTVLAQRSSARS